LLSARRHYNPTAAKKEKDYKAKGETSDESAATRRYFRGHAAQVR
jgi:hypothetical protein